MLCTVDELRAIFLWPSNGVQVFPSEDVNEVHPGIYIGNSSIASDLPALKHRIIGYVLNASYGQDAELNLLQALPDEEYENAGIKFLGIPAIDMMSFPLFRYFEEAITFISAAQANGSQVLVHCKQGISRSATLVLAFLVRVERLTVQEAARMVRQYREVLPNDGFCHQLCELNETVHGMNPSSSYE